MCNPRESPGLLHRSSFDRGGTLARKKHAKSFSSEELSLSRNQSGEYYSNKLRSVGRKRIVTIVLGSLAAILLVGGIAVAAFVNDINTKITGRVDKNLKSVLTVEEPGKPFYLLLIGVDKDEGRTKDPQYGKEDSGYRSDSIMLTRIDPGEKKVTMVSIHRDTMYDFGEQGVQKINAAYTIGQETFTTKTISDFAGVPISHYAEVDMDGLAAVIDLLGGIDIELDMDVKDPYYTGIDLKKGKHHLDGHTAALFCRCRHAYDALGDGDRYRAANQRMVLSIVAKKVLSSNPATMASTVTTMASHIRTDMDVQSIVSLALQFVGMDFENDIYTGMEPTTALYTNATWFEICDETAWRKMMSRVDQGLPPTEDGDADPLVGSADADVSGFMIDSTGTEAVDGEIYAYGSDEYDYQYQYDDEVTYTNNRQSSNRQTNYAETEYETSYEEPAYEQQSSNQAEAPAEPEAPAYVPEPEPEPEPVYVEPTVPVTPEPEVGGGDVGDTGGGSSDSGTGGESESGGSE